MEVGCTLHGSFGIQFVLGRQMGVKLCWWVGGMFDACVFHELTCPDLGVCVPSGRLTIGVLYNG